MAAKNLADYAQQKLEEAKRNLAAVVNDFSIPDEQILEIRQSVRAASTEAAKAKRKKGFFGFLGL